MAEAHDALICVGEKSFVDDKNIPKYNFNHHILSREEIIEIFKDIPEAIRK